MDINAAFPSNWLKAADLQGRAVRVTIKEVISEDIGDGHKPVVYFQNGNKGLVLNKTNALAIADIYGSDTDNWAGAIVEVYPDKTTFQGRRVDCLRVRVPNNAPPRQASAPTTSRTPVTGMGDDLGDDIPFN